MNRSKQPMNNKLNKKNQKEIRTAQSEYATKEASAYSDQLTAREMLKKYPKKTSKKEKASLASLEKEISAKKAKKLKKHSKRTTPGTVPATSSPRNVHMEGGRWIKSLEKQSFTQQKLVVKKSLKKKR